MAIAASGIVGMINDDAIAFANLVSLEDVREPANVAVQLLKGQRPFVSRFAFPKDRDFVSSSGPFRCRSRQFSETFSFPPTNHCAKGAFHFSTLFQRFSQTSSPASRAQNFSGLLDRLAIHPPVLLQAFDARSFSENLRRFEDPLLDQVRLDVFRHAEKASDAHAPLNPKLTD